MSTTAPIELLSSLRHEARPDLRAEPEACLFDPIPGHTGLRYGSVQVSTPVSGLEG